MSGIRLVPPEVVKANHDRARRKREALRPRSPVPKALNVQQVLDLGNLVFFTFRGRAYGVPPIPYKVGHRFAQAAADLGRLAKGMTPDRIPEYQTIVSTLPGLMWRHVRSVGRARRVLRRLGLLRNPFEAATAQELATLLGFFISCQTRSTVGFPTMETDPPFHPSPQTA